MLSSPRYKHSPEAPSPRMNIGPNDLVLDVGSGHNPNPRSDVLCDRYIDDDTERGSKRRYD